MISSCVDATHGSGGVIPSPNRRMNRPQTDSTNPVSASSGAKPLHRLRLVREQQGLTLRTISRRTGVSVRQLRAEEDPYSDLPVSVLHRWQEALEVPLSELLVEPGNSLSLVVGQRAMLLRVMKTALSLQESAREAKLKRLAEMLCKQLQELMPELSQQTAWPTVGSRRSQDELGKIAENPLRLDFDEPA